MSFSGAQVTRLGLYGGSRSPYSSFAGKAEFIQVAFNKSMLASQNVRRAMRRYRGRR